MLVHFFIRIVLFLLCILLSNLWNWSIWFIINSYTCNFLTSSAQASSLQVSSILDNFLGEPKLANSLSSKEGGVESALKSSSNYNKNNRTKYYIINFNEIYTCPKLWDGSLVNELDKFSLGEMSRLSVSWPSLVHLDISLKLDKSFSSSQK